MVLALSAMAACAAGSGAAPKYLGYEGLAIGDDLVNFLVSMQGADSDADVNTYAECIAAKYALDNGFGFARLVRANVVQQGSVWRGDAVYSLSAALPAGSRTIDAEVVVQNCIQLGVSTV
jgi:hypothetical protein